MKLTQINNIYQLAFLPNLFPVNCYLVEESDGLTLIDAALPYCAKGILQAAERIGKPITNIVLTHAHDDHVGALDALKRVLTDVPVFISKRDARLMAGDMTLEQEEPNTPIKGSVSTKIKTRADILLEAAAQIADTKGIEEVTLAALAQHLGVKSPSLYNHVKGLPDVRKKLGIYAMEKLYHLLEQEVENKQKDDAIQALGFAYVSFVREHPGLYEATLLRDEDVQKAGDGIVSICLRVLQEYDLKGEQALHATRGLRSICHGFASLEQHGGFGLPIDVDKSFHLLLRSFIEGIRVMK